ncbi:MAG TPA: hypothetical protein VK663_13080 [Burkholderiales bacterium]|nr:hypothetical protein [Burkholderiales bacterium]
MALWRAVKCESCSALKWCEHYRVQFELSLNANLQTNCIEHIAVRDQPDLRHQAELTHRLQSALPRYVPQAVSSASMLLERIASVTAMPVVLRSYGPTREAIQG